MSSFSEKGGPAPHLSFNLNEPKIWTTALSDLKWPGSHCSLQKAPEMQGIALVTNNASEESRCPGQKKGHVRTLALAPHGTHCYRLSKQTHEGQAGVSAWPSAPWVNISFKQLQTNDFICYTQSHCGWTLCHSFVSLSPFLSLPASLPTSLHSTHTSTF